MRIKSLGLHKTEVNTDNLSLLVSYETPVACIIRENDGKLHAYKTSQYHSVTTSKHINQWLSDNWHGVIGYHAQDWFNQLLE